MKRLFILSAIGTAMLIVLSSSRAAINLNSSKSNIYRLVYDAKAVSQAQGDALAKELDKQGALTEAKAKNWLVANFKTFGIDGTRVKVIRVLLQQGISCSASSATCQGKYQKGAKGDCFCYKSITTPDRVGQVKPTTPILILLLTNAADEPQALAVSDPGKGGKKGTKDVP